MKKHLKFLSVMLMLMIILTSCDPSPGWDMLLEDGVQYAVKYTGVGGLVYIPAVWFGDPVTVIKHGAFEKGQLDNSHVIVSKDIEIMDTKSTSNWQSDFLFSNQKNLIVEFADGMKTIPVNACRYAPGVVMVIIPETTTEIGFRAFSHCTGLKSISLPDNLVTIGGEAFYDTGLTAIYIPRSVEEIGSYAFSKSTDIKEIYIPKSVKKLSSKVFEHWTEEQTIYIEQGTNMRDWDKYWDSSCKAKIVKDCEF